MVDAVTPRTFGFSPVRRALLLMVACLLFPIFLLNKAVVYDGYFKFGLPQFMSPIASIVQLNPTSLPTLTIDSTTVSSALPVPSQSEKNYSFENLVPSTLAHPDVYAVLSSDTDFNYLFPLPLVILSWRRIGVNSIVILIGTREQFETNTKLVFILRTIEQMNVQVFFMSSKMTSTFTLAQTARLFVAGFAGVKLNDTDILITADSDMFSFIYEEHVPDVSKGKQVFLYNSRCCGLQFRRGSRHLHIPINTIATSVRIWREIMLIAPDSVTTGDHIVRRLNSEFSPALLTGPGRKASGSEKWSIDQKLISTLLHEWNISRPENAALIDEHQYVMYENRFDRSRWHSYTFRLRNLQNISDAHFPHPLYGKYWYAITNLLQLMFNESTFFWCEIYHARFLATFTDSESHLLQ